MSNDLQKSENHEIVAGGGGSLTSFFVPGEIDSAFRENNWAVAEMVEVLTDIIRDTQTKTTTHRDGSVEETPIVTPREKMAAITMLDKKAKEAMVLGGLIQKDQLTIRKTMEDGSKAEYNAERMRLAQEGSSRLRSTLAILEDASKGQGDVIDVEAEDERSDDGRNESGGRRGPSLPRRPRGSDHSDGPSGTRGGNGPLSDGSGGAGICVPGHGKERADTAQSHREGEDNDQGTAGGTEGERGSGLPEQSGRGPEGEGPGGEGTEHRGGDRPNPVAPKRPIIPGEGATRRANWWDSGTPRRSPDSDAGSTRDCVTAESSLDRLKRIERAREQAAAAAASYLEKRKNNQRPSNLAPGDEPRSCS